jgi:hypothetical protein
MDGTLFCPFTRQPCMGRMCACAVKNTNACYNPDTAGSKEWAHRWYCGLLTHGEIGTQRYVDKEPNDYRRD